MKTYRIIILLLMVIAASLPNGKLSAQYAQGAVFDNYNPVNGQFINPTHIVDSKVWLDINLAGVNAYVYNNYFYYPDTRLFNFESFQYEPRYDTANPIFNAWENVYVAGPSFSLTLGKNAISVFSAVRAVGNVKNIPSVLPKSSTSAGLNNSDTGFYNIEKARGKVMGWAEVGATFGRILKVDDDVMYVGAVSAKYLFAGMATSVNLNEGLMHIVTPDSVVIAPKNGKYSYAEPELNAGKGFGIDVGFTYKKMKQNVVNYKPHSPDDQCRYIDYQYKIGVSLIDIGFLRYKKNAYYGDLEELIFLDTIQNSDDVLEEIKRQAKGYDFIAPLPMAFSIQGDYNIDDRFYINATIVQRFPTGKTFGPDAMNLLTISGRFESKWVTVSIPVSFANYEKFGLGLGLRLAFLTIGTDNIIPWLFRSDVDMASIYASIKISLFKHPGCRDKKEKKRFETNACEDWK